MFRNIRTLDWCWRWDRTTLMMPMLKPLKKEINWHGLLPRWHRWLPHWHRWLPHWHSHWEKNDLSQITNNGRVINILGKMLGLHHAKLIYDQPPMSVRQPPMSARQPPMSVRQPPMPVRQPPMPVRQPPMPVRQPPCTEFLYYHFRWSWASALKVISCFIS